jgi:hypothetical protein
MQTFDRLLSFPSPFRLSLSYLRPFSAPSPYSHFSKEILELEKQFLKEQRELAPDLRTHFRFGVKWEQIQGFHPKIRRLFSFKNATPAEILAHRKKMAVEKWRR